MRILCAIGIHKWNREWDSRWNLNVGIRCLRCGKTPRGEHKPMPDNPPKAPPPPQRKP